ncbi:hypothetical protein TWF106_009410 [Orbilia oligospora]|uniref:Uncharacterized protein n=1 Tax=Orbilia oligospora TaxID=2813651 RepID=A0A7C8UMW6_ORBOL|nr:hypothetical protein TWF106_009410 [Orbilia oligospora]KAF3219008.1 hypothetical protein TWF679_000417 [Orbilia oligospora]
MQFSTLIQATVVALYATMAAAAVIPTFDIDSSAEDHLLAKRDGIRFTGSLYPGGPEVDLTGTLNEIIPELKKLYPDLNPVSTATTSASSPNVAELIIKNCEDGPQRGIRGQIVTKYNKIGFKVGIGSAECLGTNSGLS